MWTALPKSAEALIQWTWPQIEPYYNDLEARELTSASVAEWLDDWSNVTAHVQEMQTRLFVATTVNTVDTQAETRYATYLQGVYPAYQSAEQKLKQKLLVSGLEPQGFEIPLRNMRSDAALFREANLPLLAEEKKLVTEYEKLVGAQSAMWEGRELTLLQLEPFYRDPDRAVRERAWRLAMQRHMADRDAMNTLWQSALRVRRQLAAIAGMGDDYRAYRWQQMLRFDYTPADCLKFHAAIEDVVVPLASRMYEQRRKQLGVDTLRPWDLDVDPFGREPLHPFENIDELQDKASQIFHHVDTALGTQFDTMRREGLLDLENRKNKAGGGYCIEYYAIRRPFILMNAVGLHDDVQTLLHEAGHAFHVFEASALRYVQQMYIGNEIAEVASMSMELLSAPYLTHQHGGYYDEREAARARLEHLTSSLLWWPYMAVVDGFQHWAYENPDAALDAAQCDAQWVQLWQRFMPGIDWSGLEDELRLGWHLKMHIHQDPFYYVEYGLAQLGAVQVWRNALSDQAGAVARYRHALSLGGSKPLPQLFAAAGAKFAFDAHTLRDAVKLMETTIVELNKVDHG